MKLVDGIILVYVFIEKWREKKVSSELVLSCEEPDTLTLTLSLYLSLAHTRRSN